MDINFELYLTIAVLAMAVVLVLKKFMPKRMVNISREFIGVLTLVLCLRTFVFEPFLIPSGSMLPTLTPGDFVLVKRYAYGLRLPVVGTKVVPIGSPKRGDIAVFMSLEKKPRNFIKRIVGLPGDKIAYAHGVWSLNGEPLSKDSMNVPLSEEEFNAQNTRNETRYVENLDGYKHMIWDNEYVHNFGRVWQVTVPEGHYFAMGDNRDGSADSRAWGFLPDKNLKGKAFYLWMHKTPNAAEFSFKRNRRLDKELPALSEPVLSEKAAN